MWIYYASNRVSAKYIEAVIIIINKNRREIVECSD